MAVVWAGYASYVRVHARVACVKAHVIRGVTVAVVLVK